MKNNIKVDLNDETLVGSQTANPLGYAFAKKSAAHAGGNSLPISPASTQSTLLNKLEQSGSQQTARCLYIHIPFCRVRCTFCNFFQHASGKALMERYFDFLLQEIRWKSDMAWTQAAPFQAVYVGGGTPTDLSVEQLNRLGHTIRRAFPLTPDCEITLEGRINRFSNEKFESALDGGFNRFSFGIQSFNTEVRKAAKRLDDKEHVLERIQQMAAYNRAPIVLDLLYGLPYQSMEVWQQDLADYLQSGAHGVDLYQLIEMRGQPMANLIEQGKLPQAADTPTKANMYKVGVEFMVQHHQTKLSVNHWASSNRERSIYNSLAKTNAEVLPIGAGAGGNFSGIAMMQHRDMNKYIEAIESKQFPVAMAFRLSESAALNAEIKSAFDRGILSKQRINAIYGDDLFSALTPLFEAWQENGLVSVEADYLVLTMAGQFWAVTLAQNVIKVIEENNIIVRAA